MRGETMSRCFVLLIHGAGDPLPAIDDSDVEWLRGRIRGLDDPITERRLDLILHSRGGDIDAAYQFGDLLRSSCSDLWVIVPYRACLTNCP